MRISDTMRYGGLVPRYHELVKRQTDVQRQIASGIKILRPSDNPGDTARANMYNQQLSTLEQNLRNLDEGIGWTEQTNVVFDQATAAVQRMNELAVHAGDATLSAENRAQIAEEVNQIIEEMLDLGALTYRGRTLLSGSQTTQPAFSATRDGQGRVTAVAYDGNGDDRQIEISPGRTLSFNILGSDEAGGDYGAFRDTGDGVDLFATAISLRDNLLANNTAAISGTSLPDLNAALDHLTVGLARLGGIQARLNDTLIANQDHMAQLQDDLSILTETDIAEAAVEAAQLETAYQAALAVGARIMQTSLLDYLR